MPLPIPIRGIVTPLITPLRSPDSIDEEGLDRCIEHVIDGGVAGVFVLGTTGEGPALSTAAQRAVVNRSVKTVAGRVPVMVGIAHASYEDSLAIARHASDAGADAVVTTGPLYFGVSQMELLAYVERLAHDSPLPVFIYNIPNCSHVRFAVETVEKASELANVAGVKDSSAEMIYFHRVRSAVSHRQNFAVLMGPEELTGEAVLTGAHGGVNGGSNLFPSLYVSMYEAAARGDSTEVARLQSRILSVSAAVYDPTYLPGMKCAAAALGLCREVFSAPYEPVPEPRRRAIQEFIERMD